MRSAAPTTASWRYCARHRAGMRIFADHPRLAIAEAAANAGDQRDRLILLDQDRSLLDMHLDIGADVART